MAGGPDAVRRLLAVCAVLCAIGGVVLAASALPLLTTASPASDAFEAETDSEAGELTFPWEDQSAAADEADGDSGAEPTTDDGVGRSTADAPAEGEPGGDGAAADELGGGEADATGSAAAESGADVGEYAAHGGDAGIDGEAAGLADSSGGRVLYGLAALFSGMLGDDPGSPSVDDRPAEPGRDSGTSAEEALADDRIGGEFGDAIGPAAGSDEFEGGADSRHPSADGENAAVDSDGEAIDGNPEEYGGDGETVADGEAEGTGTTADAEPTGDGAAESDSTNDGADDGSESGDPAGETGEQTGSSDTESQIGDGERDGGRTAGDGGDDAHEAGENARSSETDAETADPEEPDSTARDDGEEPSAAAEESSAADDGESSDDEPTDEDETADEDGGFEDLLPDLSTIELLVAAVAGAVLAGGYLVLRHRHLIGAIPSLPLRLVSLLLSIVVRCSGALERAVAALRRLESIAQLPGLIVGAIGAAVERARDRAREVCAALPPFSGAADDTAAERAPETRLPARDRIRRAFESVIDASGMYRTRVATATPADVARRATNAGAPAAPVETITNSFRDVEYGGRDPESYVDEARTAHERLRSQLDAQSGDDNGDEGSGSRDVPEDRGDSDDGGRDERGPTGVTDE